MSGVIFDKILSRIREDQTAGLIPDDASSQNQLATQQFVTDHISEADAQYLGSVNIVSDLNLAVDASTASVSTALSSYFPNANFNDFCWVQIPVSADLPTRIWRLDRYKFGANSTWLFEYSFTIADLDKEKVISEAFAYLYNQVEDLKASLIGEGYNRVNVKFNQVDAQEIYSYGVPAILISSTAGAPSAANVPDNWDIETMGAWSGYPFFIGQLYLDKSTPKLYCAKAVTASTGDWFNV